MSGPDREQREAPPPRESGERLQQVGDHRRADDDHEGGARSHEVGAGAEERLPDEPHERGAEHGERRQDRGPGGGEGDGAEREGRDGIRPDVEALDEEEDPELTDGEQLAVGLHPPHPDVANPPSLMFRLEAKHGDVADLGRPAGAEPFRRVPAHRDGRRPQRPRAPSDAAGSAFAAAHRESFEAMLAEHPARRAVLEHSWRPGWISDWLALPPDGPGRTFAEEIDDVRALGDKQVRACLRESSPEATLPRILTRPGTAEHAAQLLEWVWTHALATDWARRERILRADIVSRTARLATHGWAAVLRDLGRDREWLGDGQLRINRFDLPSRVLDDDADLYFVPAHGTATWVGWDLPRRYAIYYPVTGALAEVDGQADDGLERLVGGGRALLLRDARRTVEHERPRRPHRYAAGLGG